MMTRQQKADEIRDLITQVNARIAELEEDDCEVSFTSSSTSVLDGIKGKIIEVNVKRTTKL